MSIPIGPTSLDAPEWIQAVGSIIAIAVTAILAGLDGRARRREQLATRKENLQKRARFARVMSRTINGLKAELHRIMETCNGAEDEHGAMTVRFFDLPQEICDDLEFRVIEPLNKLYSLTIDSWPDPDLAIVFYTGVQEVQIAYQNFLRAEPTMRQSVSSEEFVHLYTFELSKLSASFSHLDAFLAIADAYGLFAKHEGVDDRHEIIIGGEELRRKAAA